MEGANLLLVPGRRVARPGEKVDPQIALPTDQIEALIKEDRASFTKMALDLHDSVLPVLQAIEAKDKDKLLEVGDGIDQACENCHIKYLVIRSGKGVSIGTQSRDRADARGAPSRKEGGARYVATMTPRLTACGRKSKRVARQP